MQRSRNSEVSQLFASETTKGGQPVRPLTHALSFSTSRDWRRNRWRLAADFQRGIARQCGPAAGSIQRDRAAPRSRRTGRPWPDRTRNAGRSRAHSGRPETAGPAATRSGSRSRSSIRPASSSLPIKMLRQRMVLRRRGAPEMIERQAEAPVDIGLDRVLFVAEGLDVLPGWMAPSSAGVPCSSVAQMNRTSSPICRLKRAWTSAGSSEPARLPRCLTPFT